MGGSSLGEPMQSQSVVRVGMKADEDTLKSTLLRYQQADPASWILPDKNSFALDLVGNVCDCELVGEGHSFCRETS